jgi:hypothetical protein
MSKTKKEIQDEFDKIYNSLTDVQKRSLDRIAKMSIAVMNEHAQSVPLCVIIQAPDEIKVLPVTNDPLEAIILMEHLADCFTGQKPGDMHSYKFPHANS